MSVVPSPVHTPVEAALAPSVAETRCVVDTEAAPVKACRERALVGPAGDVPVLPFEIAWDAQPMFPDPQWLPPTPAELGLTTAVTDASAFASNVGSAFSFASDVGSAFSFASDLGSTLSFASDAFNLDSVTSGTVEALAAWLPPAPLSPLVQAIHSLGTLTPMPEFTVSHALTQLSASIAQMGAELSTSILTLNASFASLMPSLQAVTDLTLNASVANLMPSLQAVTDAMTTAALPTLLPHSLSAFSLGLSETLSSTMYASAAQQHWLALDAIGSAMENLLAHDWVQQAVRSLLAGMANLTSTGGGHHLHHEAMQALRAYERGDARPMKEFIRRRLRLPDRLEDRCQTLALTLLAATWQQSVDMENEKAVQKALTSAVREGNDIDGDHQVGGRRIGYHQGRESVLWSPSPEDLVINRQLPWLETFEHPGVRYTMARLHPEERDVARFWAENPPIPWRKASELAGADAPAGERVRRKVRRLGTEAARGMQLQEEL